MIENNKIALLLVLLLGFALSLSIQQNATPELEKVQNTDITTPIVVNGTDDGWANLTGNDWFAGNGTQVNPYTISSPGDSISITSTQIGIYIFDSWDVYWTVNYTEISGGMIGIKVVNSTNGLIDNNDIHANYAIGVDITNSANVNVTNNEIYDNGSMCPPRPVNLNNQIELQSHYGSGVVYDPSNASIVKGNIIYENWVTGVWIEDGSNINVTENLIQQNDDRCGGHILGISEAPSETAGVYIEAGDSNYIFHNDFVINQEYGIQLDTNVTNNKIFENNFYSNGPGSSGSQAYDAGISNNFTCNYWNEHLTIESYEIDGGDNSDNQPKTVAFTNQSLSVDELFVLQNTTSSSISTTISETSDVSPTTTPIMTAEESDDSESVLQPTIIIVALSIVLIPRISKRY